MRMRYLVAALALVTLLDTAGCACRRCYCRPRLRRCAACCPTSCCEGTSFYPGDGVPVESSPEPLRPMPMPVPH